MSTNSLNTLNYFEFISPIACTENENVNRIAILIFFALGYLLMSLFKNKDRQNTIHEQTSFCKEDKDFFMCNLEMDASEF